MKIELKKSGIRINGKEEILLCASFFYFRIQKKEWASRAKLISALGYNCVDIYFPWNFHETEPGMFDFSEERDVDCFLKICEENNLFVVARPGPYICSEWDGGALPSWVIYNNDIRQNDEKYLAEVRKWFDKILPIIARHQIGENSNGSVILLQLENELDFFDCGDVEGYIGNLKQMAFEHGITVPLFACAGQGDIKRSGGLTDGVIPTYNFYPVFSDAAFDHNLSRYSMYMQKMGFPFMISETERKHFILKREMLAGAKLIGAYNQISGTNFSYYQSVNNWGDPLSLICTLYDFDGIIDNLGHCTKEADEALLLSELIKIYGLGLSAGEYYEMEAPIKFTEDNVGVTNTMNLANDKGKLICVRSVEDRAVLAHGSFEGNAFEISFEGFDAFALPLKQQIDDYEIIFSNNEIFSLQPLVFIKRSKPFLLIEKNGKRISVTADGIYDGIEVRFITKTEAIARIKEKRKLEITYCKDVIPTKIENCLAGKFENRNTFVKTNRSLFSDNRIWYGEAEYKIKTENRELFLQGVGDFLTVKNDEEVVFSGLCCFDDVIVGGCGDVRAIVEKWGHSNFDDARRNSLRIKAARGIEKIYEIISKTEITGWSFTEVDRFSENVKIEKSDTDPHISINSWNSTREPLFAAYYAEIIPEFQYGEEIIFSLEGMEAECMLFINGAYAAKFTQGTRSVNMTEYLHSNEKNMVELCVRKPDWAIKTGNLFMLKVRPCEFEIRQIDHTDVYDTVFEDVKLPLTLKKGSMYSLCIDHPIHCDTYGYAQGTGFRATVMMNRKVIARIVAKSDKIVQVGSPDSSKFLIPGEPDNKLYFFIEAMEDGKFEFAISEETDENYKDQYR
jgi:beta-galactosidase